MNFAVIFAGGVGRRMCNSGIPKQFLEIDDIPIIIHTLRKFEECKKIDAITIACVSTHIEYMNELVKKYNISKVKKIVQGGETGQMSIYNALKAVSEFSTSDDDVVLIHDGVRPIIDETLIVENIENVKKYGTSISSVVQKETTVIANEQSKIKEITDRSKTYIAKAPQSFYLKDILEAEENSIKNNDTNVVDSCSVMIKYGKYKEPMITICNYDNIKITTPDDFYIASALIHARKDREVFGIGG